MELHNGRTIIFPDVKIIFFIIFNVQFTINQLVAKN